MVIHADPETRSTGGSEKVPAPVPSRAWHRAPLAALLTTVGLAIAVLVSRDGTPAWQSARVVGVLGALVAACVALRARRGRGPIAFVAGLLGIAIGGGIGVPHLAKAGWSPAVVAALVALAGGAWLLVVGFVRLVRAAGPWWRRLPVAVGLLAIAYAVAVPLTVAVAVTNVPRTAVGSETPADHGLAYEEVVLRTPDGVTLSGWYVPARNGAALVVRHGAGGTRSGALDEAVVLARAGYGVLLVDARGHGRSGGRAMDFGWHGDDDVIGAVTFLLGRDDVRDGRVGVVGLSMGGEEAIGAAGTDARIRAVVAEGATGRAAADDEWLSDVYGWRGWLQEGMGRTTQWATDLLTEATPPAALRDAAAASDRPVLLIAAGEVPDEAHAAQHIAAGSPATVDVWVAPGAGHTGALAAHPGEWSRRVVAFLDGALEPS